jgi:hypothetical protein
MRERVPSTGIAGGRRVRVFEVMAGAAPAAFFPSPVMPAQADIQV